MFEPLSSSSGRSAAPALLRAGLFLLAASLAVYLPYKYATQFHAITGLYAFAFPLSGVLAFASMALAVRPEAACSCSGSMRAGVGGIAALWMVVGLLCVPSLAEMIREMPLGGAFATFHMTMQHVVLSAAILAFAVAPDRMARSLGALPGRDASRSMRLRGAGAAG